MNLGSMESYQAIKTARSIPTKATKGISTFKEIKSHRFNEIREKLENEIVKSQKIRNREMRENLESIKKIHQQKEKIYKRKQ